MQNWRLLKSQSHSVPRASNPHNALRTDGLKKQKPHTHILQDGKCQLLEGSQIHHILPNSAFTSSRRRLQPEWKDSMLFVERPLYWLLGFSCSTEPLAFHTLNHPSKSPTQKAVVCKADLIPCSPEGRTTTKRAHHHQWVPQSPWRVHPWSSRKLVHQLFLESSTRNGLWITKWEELITQWT